MRTFSEMEMRNKYLEALWEQVVAEAETIKLRERVEELEKQLNKEEHEEGR